MRILSFNITHDSSVCCYADGQIEFFCKEERISRIKRDQIPFRSLDTFFKFNAGRKVDKIVYLTPSNCEPQFENIFKRFIAKYTDVKLENHSNLTHHLHHASLSFYSSGFDHSLVFVIDRNGSIVFDDKQKIGREAESVFKYDYDNGISILYKSFWTYPEFQSNKQKTLSTLKKIYSDSVDLCIHGSCGIVKSYEAATILIGQDPLDGGKTMGLSSYGETCEYQPLFTNGSPNENLFCQIGEDISTSDLLTCFSGYENLITCEIDQNNYKLYANKAKQVQLQTQDECCNLIKKYVSSTGIKNVCLVGGYALNIVANNYYIKNLPEVNFYFEPVADDTGISIGSGMLQYHIATRDTQIKKTYDNFFHYYEQESVEGGQPFTVEQICELLTSQKSVAIFQGNPEAGPRALGHRSILFDARNPDCKNIVNKIKKREWYRPFAGIILEEKFSDYFETCGLQESKYMTINFDCLGGVENLVPGIIHVDNTCRIQTVSEDNLFLYTLLKCFYDKTDCPMLLNTSFNLSGEPLVQTKKDALKVLGNSDLDAVYFVDQEKIFFS
jgi:carbamoyltransferase